MNELVLDALGTRWWITGVADKDRSVITRTINDFEHNFSRFLASSELSRLNDDHVLQSASPELRRLIQIGLDLYDETGGVFNMTIGARLEKDGYGLTAPAQARPSTQPRSDITVHGEEIRTASHVRLDFGGFGKGYLIDRVGNLLKDQPRFIVNGGGDILVGAHEEEIFIEHPADAKLQIGSVKIQNEALASSSNQKRTWIGPDGQTKHHLISTAAEPTDQPLSLHVRAADALKADTFATVLMLVPHEQRRQLAREHQLEFLEIRTDLSFWQTANFGFVPNR